MIGVPILLNLIKYEFLSSCLLVNQITALAIDIFPVFPLTATTDTKKTDANNEKSQKKLKKIKERGYCHDRMDGGGGISCLALHSIDAAVVVLIVGIVAVPMTTTILATSFKT